MAPKVDLDPEDLLALSDQDRARFLIAALENHQKILVSKKKSSKEVRDLSKDLITTYQQAEFIKEASDSLGHIMAKTLMPRIDPNWFHKNGKPKKNGPTKRIINGLLSDLHFGSDLNSEELPMSFGKIEEARRFASICKGLAQYKPQYRDETKLYFHLAGDIIQGQLHDPRTGATLTEQVARAIHIISSGLVFLAGQFPRGVEVFCTPGNHGRNITRHKDRAVDQKWDSFENIIYYAVKKSLKYIPNIKIHIPKTGHYTYDCFSEKGFITHGDTILEIGYPGTRLDIAGMRKQINEINAAELGRGSKGYKLFAVGHVHVGSITHLPNGAILMTNGCLLPPDYYAVSRGNFHTACGQWIWESVENHIVGDHRFLVVDAATDKDSSLDSIIMPFNGF
jgi:hypothetical protein